MGRKKFTEKQLAAKCKHWAKLTDWNCHGECIEDIARFFMLENLVMVFKHINAIHDIIGHLPTKLLEFRYEQYCKVFECIEIGYGKDVAQRVRKCT